MTEPAPEPLTPLGDAVLVPAVLALITARRPQMLDKNSDDHRLFVETVRGVCTEVQPYAGSSTTGPRWELAVWTVTLGVAAQIEDSLFDHDEHAAESLTRRYEARLAQLAGRLPGDGDGDTGAGKPPPPRGHFPKPLGYPDPAFGRRGRSINSPPDC